MNLERKRRRARAEVACVVAGVAIIAGFVALVVFALEAAKAAHSDYPFSLGD